MTTQCGRRKTELEHSQPFPPYVSSTVPHGSPQPSLQGADGLIQLWMQHSLIRSLITSSNPTERTLQINTQTCEIHGWKLVTYVKWQLASLGTKGSDPIKTYLLIYEWKESGRTREQNRNGNTDISSCYTWTRGTQIKTFCLVLQS